MELKQWSAKLGAALSMNHDTPKDGSTVFNVNDCANTIGALCWIVMDPDRATGLDTLNH
jgi:hypothetical protein